MFRPSIGFQLGFVPISEQSAACSEQGRRLARNSVSSFETSMFGSSHRVQIKEESSDDESDYDQSYSYFGCGARKQRKIQTPKVRHLTKRK